MLSEEFASSVLFKMLKMDPIPMTIARYAMLHISQCYVTSAFDWLVQDAFHCSHSDSDLTLPSFL